MRKRVLIFIDNMRFGGSQEWVVNFCRNMTEYEITVLTVFPDNDYEAQLNELKHVQVQYVLKSYSGGIWLRVLAIPAVLVKFWSMRSRLISSFDWVNVRLTFTLLLWWLYRLTKTTRCHYCVDADARQLSAYEKIIFKFCIPSFTTVSIANSIRSGYSFIDIDQRLIKSDPFFVSVRNSSNPMVYESRINLLFIARLIPQKGLMDALKIIHRLSALTNGESHLHVIGDGPDLPYAEAVCKEWGLTNVTFHGFQSDLEVFLHNCDGVIKTAHQEPANSVVRETLCAGRRVFSTIESRLDEELEAKMLLVRIDRNEIDASATTILRCIESDIADKSRLESLVVSSYDVFHVGSVKTYYMDLIEGE